MASFLELCNMVILEGGFEMNPLTEANWSSIEAGRRRYPYIKAKVNSAWKDMQISRNEWEFKDKETTVTILPRLMVNDISGGLPVPGDIYVGEESNLTITVENILAAPDNMYYVDFSADGEYNRVPYGEVYNSGGKSFTYRGRGAYRLSDLDPTMREPLWSTFIGYQTGRVPMPIRFIPWENWLYKEISYTTSTRSAPSFVSQDYKGDLLFYPQTLSPVEVNFVYTTAPQELVLPTDSPSTTLLPAEYHDWVAWEALAEIARYDKNPDLQAYAQSRIDFYKSRAERNLMPVVRWASSRYNSYERNQ